MSTSEEETLKVGAGFHVRGAAEQALKLVVLGLQNAKVTLFPSFLSLGLPFTHTP